MEHNCYIAVFISLDSSLPFVKKIFLTDSWILQRILIICFKLYLVRKNLWHRTKLYYDRTSKRNEVSPTKKTPTAKFVQFNDSLELDIFKSEGIV